VGSGTPTPALTARMSELSIRRVGADPGMQSLVSSRMFSIVISEFFDPEEAEELTRTHTLNTPTKVHIRE
jgi:hypothetical protein